MRLDNYMNITNKNCEMENKRTDDPAVLVTFTVFFVAIA